MHTEEYRIEFTKYFQKLRNRNEIDYALAYSQFVENHPSEVYFGGQGPSYRGISNHTACMVRQHILRLFFPA